MLIDEHLAKRLTKSQLIEVIAYCMELSDLKKADLLSIFLNYINEKELWQKKILKKFPHSFALSPSGLEKMLGITPSERIRWTKAEMLPVVAEDPQTKPNFDSFYPTYDYFETLKILQKNKVEQLRLLPKEYFNKEKHAPVKVAIEPRPIHPSFYHHNDDYDYYEDSYDYNDNGNEGYDNYTEDWNEI